MKNIMKYLPLVSSEIYLYEQEHHKSEERDKMIKQIVKGGTLFIYDLAGLVGLLYIIGEGCRK